VKGSNFVEFCYEWGIQNIRSSPYMPHSNGIAKSVVKKLNRANLSFNSVLKKASGMSGLQMFRNTPRSGTGECPAQLIFGQDIRYSLSCNRQSM
jgi:predicted transglutaminase-like cysteine proteinase